MFGFMSSKAHLAHIALNEPITSIVHQCSSLSSSPTSPSRNPLYKPTFGSLTLCQVQSGWRQWQIPLGLGSVSSPSSMGSASSPPNQAAERGVCVLTTSRSRRHGIQQITAVDPANWTNHSLFSFKQLFSVLTSESLSALLRTNFKKSFEITFGFLTAPSWQIPWDDDTAASTNCRPAPA